jgi:hypothetical protein
MSIKLLSLSLSLSLNVAYGPTEQQLESVDYNMKDVYTRVVRSVSYGAQPCTNTFSQRCLQSLHPHALLSKFSKKMCKYLFTRMQAL